jgi:hypothetical protein
MATVIRTLPRDARCFTGRAWELRELAALVGDDASGGPPRVCAIDGMAGSGKSAFAVRFAREFAASFPDGCFHVRLYGHSADQRQASPLDVAGEAGEHPGGVGRVEDADSEVAELMRLCGHLPQAIGLLAGHLARHRAGTVADLIAPMIRPGARLALLVGEHESIAAAFDLSYRSLPADLRRLFRHLGLHPGPEIDPWSVGALDGCAPESARARLKRLAAYHLIENPAEDRFRFHDLIADHARILAAADPAADRAAAERRLLDYDLHMARAADRFLARRTATGVPAIATAEPDHAPELPTRHAAVTWLDANYPQLLAAAGYAAAHDYPDYAIAISAAMNGYPQIATLPRCPAGWPVTASRQRSEFRRAPDCSRGPCRPVADQASGAP